MKNLEKLKKEQAELKEKLARLVDFTTSEEYFTLTDGEKGLLNQQRVGMELYLASLTKRIYGTPDATDGSSLIWLTMLMGMFNSPSSMGFGSSKSREDLEKAISQNPAKTEE